MKNVSFAHCYQLNRTATQSNVTRHVTTNTHVA